MVIPPFVGRNLIMNLFQSMDSARKQDL